MRAGVATGGVMSWFCYLVHLVGLDWGLPGEVVAGVYLIGLAVLGDYWHGCGN
jgi:hypothetical protein